MQAAGAPLPVLIELASWVGDLTPTDLVRSRWTLPGDPVGGLRDGDVWLVLDGLNEMGADAEERVRRLREWLKSPEAPARIVITCRAGDYDSAGLQLDGVPAVAIKDLDEVQVRAFAGNYLGDKAPAFLDRILPAPGGEYEQWSLSPLDYNPYEHDLLQVQFDARQRALSPLARKPYFLLALIIVFEHSGGLALPRNAGTLFRLLAGALWEREGKRGTPGWTPYSEVEPAFAALAFAMIHERRGTVVSRDYAEEKLGGPRLLLAGLSANYLTREGDTVRFYHQLLQEFFAAVGLKQAGGLDAGWLLEPGRPRYGYLPGGTTSINPLTFATRAPNEWDHAIVALSGIVDDPGALIERLLSFDPVLAVRCLGSGVQLSPAARRRALDTLIELLRHAPWNEVAAVTAALRRLHDRDLVAGLVAVLVEKPAGWSLVDPREAAALVLGTIACPEAVSGLRAALNCDSAAVRARAAQALGKIADPAAVPDLAYHLGDADPTSWFAYGTTTQEEAARALLAIAKDAPGVVVSAVLEALRGPHKPTRLAAARLLGKVGDRAAFPGLRDALLNDIDPEVQTTAAQALGEIGDPEALSVLFRELSEPDRDRGHLLRIFVHEFLRSSRVMFEPDRERAVRAVVSALERCRPATLPILLETLVSAPEKVRCWVAAALGRIGGPTALEALERASSDENEQVARAAASAAEEVRRATETGGR
jgi:HEAT repeat protein